MTGSDHSKKPKNVTIDLSKDSVREAEAAPIMAETPKIPDNDRPVADPKPVVQTASPKPAEPVKPAASPAPKPTAPAPSGSGFFGKLGAGFAGGVIALAGAAGLQYAGQLPTFGSNADLTALQAQVNELASKPTFDPAPLQAALDAANGEIRVLKDSLASLSAGSSDSPALQLLNDKIAALEAALAAVPAGSGVDNGAIQALSAKVAALESAQAPASEASAVALAIAASGLKAAIDRGGPFPAELDTYASVAPASADVDALRTLAGSGVPSQADLIAGFNNAANAMIAAATVPDPDASILERLTDSAANLVKTRRVGDIQGDEPDAVVARMEVALNRGDLDLVLAEGAKLPGASMAAGKDWLDRVTARRDANTLVSRALGEALKAAGGKS